MLDPLKMGAEDDITLKERSTRQTKLADSVP